MGQMNAGEVMIGIYSTYRAKSTISQLEEAGGGYPEKKGKKKRNAQAKEGATPIACWHSKRGSSQGEDLRRR